MNKNLQVYWEKNIVGRLWQDERGDFFFQYAAEWVSNPLAVPLSARLPLQKDVFPDPACHFFFPNLLPEGNVRMLVARKLGISEENDFELLRALGGDCAGAISLLPDGQEASDQGDYELIKPQELDQMIEEMASNPLLVWKEELRLSLAGAQQKLPVYFKDGKIYLPRGSYPSSHILKPKMARFEHLVENEAFCMMLAKRYGLPVPEAAIFQAKEPVYLVERYDRKKDPQGRLFRLHQEDFCQALGYSYANKYEGEGGPDLKKCFTLLSNHGTQPIVDKKILLEWVMFNYLAGNCDAHAKNLSMLISKEDYRLAPLYDLISTRAYPSLSPKLAMRIGGQSRPEWILREHWEKLARDAEVGPKAVLAMCQEMSEKLPNLAAQLAKEFTAKYGSAEFIEKMVKNISTLSKKTLASLKDNTKSASPTHRASNP